MFTGSLRLLALIDNKLPRKRPEPMAFSGGLWAREASEPPNPPPPPPLPPPGKPPGEVATAMVNAVTGQCFQVFRMPLAPEKFQPTFLIAQMFG